MNTYFICWYCYDTTKYSYTSLLAGGGGWCAQCNERLVHISLDTIIENGTTSASIKSLIEIYDKLPYRGKFNARAKKRRKGSLNRLVRILERHENMDMRSLL